MKHAPEHSPNRRSRRFLLGLAGLTAVALLLRLAVAAQLCAQPFTAQPPAGTDMETYRRLALNIARGEWPDHFYYQPFYYAVFLPAVYRIFGPGPWGPALAQLALSTAAVWLTGLSAARLFGRRGGLLAAALLALARFQIFYVPFLLLEVLQTFWVTLLLYLAIRFWENRSPGALALLGLVTSAAVLTRGNAILFAPGVAALVFWRLRARPARATAAVLLYAALVYAPQMPFALRNLHHFGHWTGPSSAQDAVLALGNSPEAPPGGLEYPATYHDWVAQAGLPPGRRVPVSRQILAWVRQAPLQFLELKFRMLVLYWYQFEIPNNINIRQEGRFSPVLGWPILVPFGLIGVLALFGLLTGLRRRSVRHLFLGYAVGVHWAGTVLFYILARFRLSAVPLLCVLAGAGGVAAVRRVRALRRGRPDARLRALTGLLAAAFSGFVVLAGFPWYQTVLESWLCRRLRPDGVRVETPRRVLVYDHGPYSLGGLRALTVPPEGIVVRKRFVLSGMRVAEGTPVLRIPAILAEGCGLQVRVSAGGVEYGPEAVRTEREDFGRQRLAVPLDGLPSPEAAAEVAVALRCPTGSCAVLIDTLRWYGRSEFLGREGALPLRAEAAFELEWRRDSPAP